MAIQRLHLAAAAAAAYAGFVLVGTVVRFALSGDGLTLRFVFAQPLTWLVGLVGVVVAWGLLSRFSWAWWLGIVAAAVQLYRVAAPIIEHTSFTRPPPLVPVLVAALLLTFIVLVFPSHVRASCSR